MIVYLMTSMVPSHPRVIAGGPWGDVWRVFSETGGPDQVLRSHTGGKDLQEISLAGKWVLEG